MREEEEEENNCAERMEINLEAKMFMNKQPAKDAKEDGCGQEATEN